jgi:hypothetical protein
MEFEIRISAGEINNRVSYKIEANWWFLTEQYALQRVRLANFKVHLTSILSQN